MPSEAQGVDVAASSAPIASAPISISTEQLLDFAPDGVVIADASGLIRLVNRHAEALFGYAREELVGQPIELLIPARARLDHVARRDEYVRSPTTRPIGAGLELAGQRKDGHEFPVDISLSSIETDRGVMVAALVRDVSERKKIEARFPGLLEAAQDAIVAVDAAGVIHLVNRQAQVLFGYSRDELIGRQLDTLIPERVRGVHPNHQAAYFANPTPRPMGAGLEPTARRKDGTEFPVDISLSSLETKDGVLVSAAVRDITDRKRLEDERGVYQATLLEEKRDLEASLLEEKRGEEASLLEEKRGQEASLLEEKRGQEASLLEERRDLEASRLEEKRGKERGKLEAQLQQAQRLESIGQLAGGVAHDFNNLLAGIMNYAGLVTASLQKEMDQRGLSGDKAFVTVVEDVEQITKVAKRAAALTHQLLIFSRRTAVQPEVLDLNAVIHDLESLLRTTIGEAVELRTLFEADLPLIKADRGQLDQVLMNLAVNARDAMPGGGQLEVKTGTFEADQLYARLNAIEPGTYVRLTVTDTGVGMSREVVARTFEPFFTTKPKGQGTGLGLATVYGIVTEAGGNVLIYSVPGLGTTVRVHLPATSSPKSPPRDSKPSLLSSQGETVLLVEDEEIVREPAQRILASHGYDVLAAANADEAMAIVRAHSGEINLLLTDVVMPGRSGKELSITVNELRPATKVIFMSGYSQDVIIHQGVLEEGATLIEKPFSSDDLLHKVRDVLDGGL